MKAEGFADYSCLLSSPHSYHGHIERERHLPNALKAGHTGSMLKGKRRGNGHQKDVRIP